MDTQNLLERNTIDPALGCVYYACCDRNSGGSGSPSSESAPAVSTGEKVLTVALTTIPNSLDMPKAAERNASNAAWQLYDSLTRVAAIQTGEVDIVSRLSAEEADSLRDQEGIEVISYPVDRVYYIAFNNMTTGLGFIKE